MKNRTKLAEHFRNIGLRKGVEVGVFSGFYSETLCKTIPGLRLDAVDPYEVYKGYRDHKFVGSMEEAYKHAQKLLEPFPNAHIIKKFSVDAVKEFKDEELDFVYIDGNHKYEYVKQDIELWSPKVRKDGIISGHDYYVTNSGNFGVVNAVNEYATEHNLDLQVTNWDPTAESEDERQPSWFYIKK